MLGATVGTSRGAADAASSSKRSALTVSLTSKPSSLPSEHLSSSISDFLSTAANTITPSGPSLASSPLRRPRMKSTAPIAQSSSPPTAPATMAMSIVVSRLPDDSSPPSSSALKLSSSLISALPASGVMLSTPGILAKAEGFKTASFSSTNTTRTLTLAVAEEKSARSERMRRRPHISSPVSCCSDTIWAVWNSEADARR
mmetsp:Transcript_30354/g.46689  ORF Transcript_30354/g.46689 Transcript_30354/m.46689 type:complete len:200 (+) Transcript_30354:338-937(+)